MNKEGKYTSIRTKTKIYFHIIGEKDCFKIYGEEKVD